MANIFCITYGGCANNGNTYIPYKAIAHTAEEAIAVINTWKTYGRKTSTDCIVVNERTAEKIRDLFRDGFGTVPSGVPRTYAGFRTTGCGAWEIGFHPALADTIEEHERIYNERREAARKERLRLAEAAKQRRMAELMEPKKGWWHVELELTIYVFASHGNDYFEDTTFEGNVIANSGADAYDKARNYIREHPEELETSRMRRRGDWGVLQSCAEMTSKGYDCAFLGAKVDGGYSIEKWEEKNNH